MWALISTADLTVSYYHVTYVFQSESKLYSFLNFKKVLAQNRHNIWALSDSNNGIRPDDHLIHKRTLHHLAKLTKWLRCGVRTYQSVLLENLSKRLSGCLRTKWLWVRIPLLSCKLQISCLFWARRFLTFRQKLSVRCIWQVCLNVWNFFNELSSCGFESGCRHLIMFSFSLLSFSHLELFIIMM